VGGETLERHQKTEAKLTTSGGLIEALGKAIEELECAHLEIHIIYGICHDYERMPEEEKTIRLRHIRDSCDRNGDHFGEAVIEFKEILENARAHEVPA
jgi:hypothetical protein